MSKCYMQKGRPIGQWANEIIHIYFKNKFMIKIKKEVLTVNFSSVYSYDYKFHESSR